MSSASHQPLPIDRREALRRAALLLGSLVSAPTIAGVLAGCEAPPATGGRWTPKALTASQGELVEALVDRIIPATDTPGAREAGVHRFIDRMLAEYYDAGERREFLAGLDDVNRRAESATGRDFARAAPAAQHALLSALDHDAYAPGARASFFRTMKELTLLGYYTSAIGATRELRYDPVPGRFEGCVSLASLGRASAT